MSQPQELGQRTQILDVVPPGPIHRNRRTALIKFTHRIPNLRDPACIFNLIPDPRAGVVAEQAARKKDDTVSRLRPSSQQPQRGGPECIKVPLLLEQRGVNPGGSGPPTAVYKGVPEAGGGANVDGPPLHYVLYRSGNRVTAFPAEQWFAFKPHVDRRGLLDSVAAANAAAGRPGPGGGNAANKGLTLDPFALRLVPKSQRVEKQRQEEEARERQEQVATGRMLPLVGEAGYDFGLGAGGGRLKHFVDEDDLEEELFGNDEEDEAPRFGGKGGKGGKKGRGRSLKTADGEELAEDEVPEDLYAGPAVDEDLRPEKPEEAEDWEHEFEPDDDDQDQGHDEVYEDDPGMRKKLGIEGDDEDEGEEADEQARKLQKLGDPDDSDQEEEERKKKEEEDAKQQHAAGMAAAGGSFAGAGTEEDNDEYEDEDELDELDEMEEEPSKPSPPGLPSVPPPATRPPLAPGTSAAAVGATPSATGAKRKASEESWPATEAVAQNAKRARTATPPPPQAAGPTAASAASRPAAGGSPTGTGSPAAAAAQLQRPTGPAPGATGARPATANTAGGSRPVTAEEVMELLRSRPNGTMAFQDFTRHFAPRTTTPDLRAALKTLTVSLCKSSKNEAGQLLVSLKK